MAGGKDWKEEFAKLSAKLSANKVEIQELGKLYDDVLMKIKRDERRIEELKKIAKATPGTLNEVGAYVDSYGYETYSPSQIEDAPIQIVSLQNYVSGYNA